MILDQITVQSNASLRLFPKNTGSHFIAQLPCYKEFQGDCVIGISEIHFPLEFIDKNKKTNSVINSFSDEKQAPVDVQTQTEDTIIQSHSKSSEITLSLDTDKINIITNINNNNDENNDNYLIKKRMKRAVPSIVVEPVLPESTKTSSDQNYRNIITQLRNQYLQSYEDLQKTIQDCRSSLRQSELLKECGDIVKNHFDKAISDIHSQQNHLSIFLANFDNFLHNDQNNLEQKEVFNQIKSKSDHIRHMSEHLYVEFLDYIKTLQLEKQIEIEEIKTRLGKAKDYWKNNFIGLSYSAFTNTQEKNAEYIPKYLYVYCNLSENRIVGDMLGPCLRIIQVPPIRMNGQTHEKIYDNPQFFKLIKPTFDSIEIDIRDEIGDRVAFADGKVIVTLQIRKKEDTS